MTVRRVTGFLSDTPRAASLRDRLRIFESSAGAGDPLIQNKLEIGQELRRLRAVAQDDLA